MAYEIALTGKNEVEALSLLESTAKIIDGCKLNYWLDGGTLLGIIRENRLLPWDSDIDLSMLFPGEEALSELIAKLNKQNFRVKVRQFEVESKHFNKEAIRLIKVRNKSFFGLKKGNVCLEIFIRYIKNTETYCQVGEQIQVIPLSYCSPLKKVEFNNYSYTIPQLTDEYLTFKYGDWKVTNKNWCVFADDKSMVNFDAKPLNPSI